jgi:UDP-3-O-[3-hydroxymyristoyl] glucosamine N-acyltransferase
MKSYTVQEINEVLKGILEGNTSQTITAPEKMEVASNSEITFIGNKKYEKLWPASNACVAVVNEDIAIEPGENRAFIKVENADLAMSQVLELFAHPMPIFHVDIHPAAVVDQSATIGIGTKIGAGCYVGPNVRIPYCGLEQWSESVATLVLIVSYILMRLLEQMVLDFALVRKED